MKAWTSALRRFASQNFLQTQGRASCQPREDPRASQTLIPRHTHPGTPLCDAVFNFASSVERRRRVLRRIPFLPSPWARAPGCPGLSEAAAFPGEDVCSGSTQGKMCVLGRAASCHHGRRGGELAAASHLDGRLCHTCSDNVLLIMQKRTSSLFFLVISLTCIFFLHLSLCLSHLYISL